MQTRPAFAIALVAVLAWHAIQKPPELRLEMLWACHVASALMAIGLLARSTPLVAGAFVYHAAVGFPSWLLDTIATGTTTLTSTLSHLVPLAAGAFALRGARWTRAVVVAGWALQIPLFFVSRWATPPALNVNISHAPWPPLGLQSVAAGAALHLAWTLAAMLAADGVLQRTARRRQLSPPMS